MDDQIAGLPLVSFIVPVYNTRLDWLCECLDRLTAHNGLGLEVIVVDDGSTEPNVRHYLDSLSDGQDARVIVVKQSNGGVAQARNAGMAHARGTWLAFVDPDDRPTNIAAILNAAQELTTVDLVLFGARSINATSEADQHDYSLAALGDNPSPSELMNAITSVFCYGRNSLSFLLGVPWAKLYRRSFIMETPILFDTRIYKRSDAEWILRVLHASPTVSVVDISTIDYRSSVSSSISNGSNPRIPSALLLVADSVKYFPEISRRSSSLYSAELAKDAVNRAYLPSSIKAVGSARTAYLDFLSHLEPLDRIGILDWPSSTPLSKRLLYSAIQKSWYWPFFLVWAGRRLDHFKSRTVSED